jgi:hypothetical protein
MSRISQDAAGLEVSATGIVGTSQDLDPGAVVHNLTAADSASDSPFGLLGDNGEYHPGAVIAVYLVSQPSTGNVVLTPETFLDGATITFDAEDEVAVLMYLGAAGWTVLETTATVA